MNKNNRMILAIAWIMLVYGAWTVVNSYFSRGLQGPKGCNEILSEQEYKKCQRMHGAFGPYLGNLPEIIRPLNVEKSFVTAFKRRSNGIYWPGSVYLFCGLLFLFSRVSKRIKGYFLISIAGIQFLTALVYYNGGYLSLGDTVLPAVLLVMFSKSSN